MKYMYSISGDDELKKYQNFLKKNQSKIEDYIDYIVKEFNVEDLPEFIVFSNLEMATKVHKKIALPAYTNDIRMIYTPEIEVWKKIYMQQSEFFEDIEISNKIKEYYSKRSSNYILQVLGHELAHQSEMFLEGGFYEDENISIWFEEGMVEYISKKYFLTEEEYQEEKAFNSYLVDRFEKLTGYNSVDGFLPKVYSEHIAVILYYYWKSFLAIDFLVEKYKTVREVFAKYHKWDEMGRTVSLSKWFNLE